MMPLSPSTLSSGLEAVASSPGPTVAACAKSWADAMESYAQGIVPPSTTVSAAASTLETALTAAFATPAAAPGMESAFAAFGATVAGGMAPAFVGVPPSGPVGFATQFISSPPTHAAAASAVSSLINVWMKKGTATPAAGGAATPWS